MKSEIPVFSLLTALILSSCYGSSGSGHDSASDDSLTDTPIDSAPEADQDQAGDPLRDPALDLPDAAGGTIVPEGDGTLYETDSGEELTALGGFFMMPAAFSGAVYTILMAEDINTPGTDRVGAYRLAPGGGTLGTTWIGTVSTSVSASICWSGVNFLALFADSVTGIQLFAVDEAGILVRPTEILGSIPSGNGNTWSSEDPTHIFCLDSGPMVVDFTSPGTETMDNVYLLLPDGSPEGSVRQYELPVPAQDENPTCTSVGDRGACLTGGVPPIAEAHVFFFDRSGATWTSGGLGPDVDFGHGCGIAAAGNRAAVFWIDSSSGRDKEQFGYALVDAGGEVLVPARLTGIMVNTSDLDIFAASSGSDILVVGPTPKTYEGRFGFRVYLFDLLGNLLDGPVPLDTSMETGLAASVFWEGDAYSVLWPISGGIKYRRFRIERL